MTEPTLESLTASLERERAIGMPRWNIHDYIRILITGSRDWEDEGYVWRLLTHYYGVYYQDDQGNLQKVKIVHGACPTGVDHFTQGWCDSFGADFERHPANWDLPNRMGGPVRNQEMVDLGARICLALPMRGSKGTKDCMERALFRGIHVKNYGTVSMCGIAPINFDQELAEEEGQDALDHQRSTSQSTH